MSNQIDFSVLLQAPLASALSIILGFGLAWVIVRYIYQERIRFLQEQLQLLEDKFQSMDERIKFLQDIRDRL